jgi:surface protein
MSLQTAVSLWCDSLSSAEATYGDIKLWDTSKVEGMEILFGQSWDGVEGHCSTNTNFNADISGWDTSRVTSLSQSKL